MKWYQFYLTDGLPDPANPFCNPPSFATPPSSSSSQLQQQQQQQNDDHQQTVLTPIVQTPPRPQLKDVHYAHRSTKPHGSLDQESHHQQQKHNSPLTPPRPIRPQHESVLKQQQEEDEEEQHQQQHQQQQLHPNTPSRPPRPDHDLHNDQPHSLTNAPRMTPPRLAPTQPHSDELRAHGDADGDDNNNHYIIQVNSNNNDLEPHTTTPPLTQPAYSNSPPGAIELTPPKQNTTTPQQQQQTAQPATTPPQQQPVGKLPPDGSLIKAWRENKHTQQVWYPVILLVALACIVIMAFVPQFGSDVKLQSLDSIRFVLTPPIIMLFAAFCLTTAHSIYMVCTGKGRWPNEYKLRDTRSVVFYIVQALLIALSSLLAIAAVLIWINHFSTFHIHASMIAVVTWWFSVIIGAVALAWMNTRAIFDLIQVMRRPKLFATGSSRL